VREVAVLIPFFQREPGILARALASVMAQRVPAPWSVAVFVVDDGSPCLGLGEVRQACFGGPHRVRVVRQENQGVAAARNRALDTASNSATLIAFLDSDDVWPHDHLERAIRAHEEGFDFYFTDNGRPGHHGSHVRSQCCPATNQFLAQHRQTTGLVEFQPEHLVRLILEEFPTQASTVVYRQAIAPRLRFDARLQTAGEDVLFFATLASRAARIGFDADSQVECGRGLNMYYANLSWDSAPYLAIKLDQLLAHSFIDKVIPLSVPTKAWNDHHVAECRNALAYHLLRNLVLHPQRVPGVVWRLLRTDPATLAALPVTMLRVGGTSLARMARREPPRGR
jgi:succinoglycan biosynthesis protein ExoW